MRNRILARKRHKVTRDEFGDKWAFTVDSGEIRRYKGGRVDKSLLEAPLNAAMFSLRMNLRDSIIENYKKGLYDREWQPYQQIKSNPKK